MLGQGILSGYECINLLLLSVARLYPFAWYLEFRRNVNLGGVILKALYFQLVNQFVSWISGDACIPGFPFYLFESMDIYVSMKIAFHQKWKIVCVFNVESFTEYKDYMWVFASSLIVYDMCIWNICSKGRVSFVFSFKKDMRWWIFEKSIVRGRVLRTWYRMIFSTMLHRVPTFVEFCIPVVTREILYNGKKVAWNTLGLNFFFHSSFRVWYYFISYWRFIRPPPFGRM